MRKPFQQLRPDERLRLTLVAVGTFYVIFTAWFLFNGGLFIPVGGDFLAFFASARIAATSGFSQVYDLSVQEAVQRDLTAPYNLSNLEILPTFFLPAFTAPFCLFLPLGLLGGFIIWTLLNLGVLIGYLAWFLGCVQERAGGGLTGQIPYIAFGTVRHSLLILTLLSFPVFLNFFFGQVNVWLLICIGEFLRAWEQGKPFRSGLWLGGLLLKPQTLILILPFLVLSGEWNAVLGFAVASAAIVGTSLGLAGLEGLKAWLIQLIRYTSNLPTINPQVMANIRMIGELLSVLLSSEALQKVAGGLSLGVALLVLLLGLRLKKRAPEEISRIWLPLLATTSIIAWHSHIHMSMILVPPLLWQVIGGRMSQRFLALWAMLPVFSFLLGGIGNLLLSACGKLSLPIPLLSFSALSLLVLNFYIVIKSLGCPNPQGN